MNTTIIQPTTETRERVVGDIMKHHSLSREVAEAAFGEAVAFMHTIAHNPDTGLGPSPTVDIAWHEFILETRLYHDYCNEAYGFYLHHRPFNDVEMETIARPIADTVQFMQDNGIVIDPDLWGMYYADADPRDVVMGNCTVDCDGGRGDSGSGGGRGNCS